MAANYAAILKGIKEKIRLARQHVIVAINSDLIRVYHEIGRTLLQQRAEKGWGAKLIDHLAKDLQESSRI